MKKLFTKEATAFRDLSSKLLSESPPYLSDQMSLVRGQFSNEDKTISQPNNLSTTQHDSQLPQDRSRRGPQLTSTSFENHTRRRALERVITVLPSDLSKKSDLYQYQKCSPPND